MNRFLSAQETEQNISDMQLAEIKNAVIKHMYFAMVSHNQCFLRTKYKMYVIKFIFHYSTELIK